MNIMNRIRRVKERVFKIFKKKGGFTFTELLVSMLIMLLATGAIIGAINLAIRHFYEQTQESEAQLLCASLAEFVEDELSYATVTDTGDGGFTWSKGTHNMGSAIHFYVLDEDDDGNVTGTQIDGTTLGKYGEIAIKGNADDDYFRLVSSGSYNVESRRGYSLAAGMSVKLSEKKIIVNIQVVDKDDKDILSSIELTVNPVISV